VQRREGSRDDQHVLLFQSNARLAAARRPDAFAAGMFADREALGAILVGPDAAPALSPPSSEYQAPAREDGLMRSPAVDDAGNAARLQRCRCGSRRDCRACVAQASARTAPAGRSALLLGDEFADVRRPALELLRLGADAGPLLETVIAHTWITRFNGPTRCVRRRREERASPALEASVRTAPQRVRPSPAGR
jgi:hypothetical protein